MQILLFGNFSIYKLAISFFQLQYSLLIDILTKMTVYSAFYLSLYNIIHHLHIRVIMEFHDLPLRKMI